jgi:hypothetical protein
MMRRPPLRDVYSKLNVKFFDARLPEPLREVTVGKGMARRGVLVRRVGVRDGLSGHRKGFFRIRVECYPAEIRVLSALPRDQEYSALLHEMVHYAMYLRGREAVDHGPDFQAEMERVEVAFQNLQDIADLRGVDLDELLT